MSFEFFTEEGVINITIKNGYDGSEFNTKQWEKHGCLRPNRTLESLVKKLETIYENVSYKGSGKKRRYTLLNKREKVIDRKYNYKGTVATEDDNMIKEYIFQKLISETFNDSNSYNQWYLELGLFSLKPISKANVGNLYKDMYYPMIYNYEEIYSEFNKTIYRFHRNIIKTTFVALEREERIRVESKYFIKKINGGIEEINYDKFKELKNEEKALVASYNVNPSYYYQSKINGGRINKEIDKIIKLIKLYFEKKYNFSYFFESYKVEILKPLSIKFFNDGDFQKAYLNKFLQLTKHRQNKTNYLESKSFWRRYYLLNTLIILEHISRFEGFEIQNLDKILKEQLRALEINMDFICEEEE